MIPCIAVHPDGELLRVSLDTDTLGTLVLKDTGAGGVEVRADTRHEEGAAGTTAIIDTRSLLGRHVWEAWLASDVDRAEQGVAGLGGPSAAPSPVVADGSGVWRLRVRTSRSGLLVLHVEPVPPHAEIERVLVEDDAVLVDASLLGPPSRGDEDTALLVARSRDRDREIAVPVTLSDTLVHGRFPLVLLAGDAEAPAGTEYWDLSVRLGNRTFRLARYLDDVSNKKHAVAFPTCTVSGTSGARRVSPYYTVNNALSVRSAAPRPPTPTLPPAPAAAHEGDAPVRRLQRHALHLTRRLALHGARTVVHRLPARRQVPPVRNGRTRVSILVLHGYGMGGTIRTVFNLAGYLARDYDVEILSQFRERARPFFPLPRGVSITPLDDRTAAGRCKGIRRLAQILLSRLPSLLVHEADVSFARCTLWTDVQLVGHLRRQQNGILITTRPALNLIAAQLSAPGLITVGQEHMNYRQHRHELARDLHRTYGALDALTVLTQADLEDYTRTLAGSATLVVRIPNMLTPLTGGRSDPRSTCIVAAGRLTRQKGFDLLLPAFARVVQHHPEWTLRIYGSGPQSGRLRRMTAELGLYNNVLLMGRADRIGDEFAKGSVFVLSSRFEGFGMVLIEAMSKGLAVVSFDCPRGPSEIITDGEDGILVPPEDVEALGQALLRVVEDEALRSSLGAAAVVTSLSYEAGAIGSHWNDLIARLVAERAPGWWSPPVPAAA